MFAPSVAPADHRLDVVVAITGDKRPHDREQVGPGGELFKRRSKKHTGNRSGNLAGHAAGIGWPADLWIEGLKLRRPAVHEEKNHRTVAGKLLHSGGIGG
jgi:hypothetical protein